MKSSKQVQPPFPLIAVQWWLKSQYCHTIMISIVLFWLLCFWLVCWHRFGTKSLELVCSLLILYCYIKLVAICRKRKNCRLWRLPAKDIVYDIFSFPNHPHHLHEASWIDCSEHEAVRHAPRSFGSLTFRRWLPSVYQSPPLGLPGPTNHIFILTYCSIAWNGKAGSSRKIPWLVQSKDALAP